MLAVGGLPDVRVFRNNCGVALHPDGSRVVYGLCPGSSDLIGFRTVTVTPDLVGRQLAQFVAIEVKTATGRVSPEQRRFLDAVERAGGLAAVVRSPEAAAALFQGGAP
ncbi:MAG: VRR-NUC domain-containing protein [Alphaproteobacteria bacterium]